MTNISYRQPEEEEASAIFKEGAKYFAKRYPYSLWTLDTVLELIKKPNIAWVAEAEGRIIGFIAGYASYRGLPSDHGFVEWCFVHPNYRRKGICTELSRRVEEYYRQQGKQYIMFDTTPDNKAIQNYLKKEGFELYVEDIFYRKKLSNAIPGNLNKYNPQPPSVTKSAESFVVDILYAGILGVLLWRFDLANLSVGYGLVFSALLLTILRWCHLHVSLAKKEFQPIMETPFGEFWGFWCSIIPLVFLFFAAMYQTSLKVVSFSLIGLLVVDFMWEIHKVAWNNKNKPKPLLITAKRWIAMDTTCLLGLAGIVIGLYYFPLVPSELISDYFYELLFFLLMLGLTAWDYIEDYKKKIGLYFKR